MATAFVPGFLKILGSIDKPVTQFFDWRPGNNNILRMDQWNKKVFVSYRLLDLFQFLLLTGFSNYKYSNKANYVKAKNSYPSNFMAVNNQVETSNQKYYC